MARKEQRRAKRGHRPFLPSHSTRSVLSPCHRACEQKQQAKGRQLLYGSAEAQQRSQLPGAGPCQAQRRGGGSRRCPARGRLPSPSESAARDGCQADKQLAPVLGNALLDPDSSPLAQRQVIVCLSGAEPLLAGSNGPGAPEAAAGRWLGEVRTYS